MKIIFLQGFIIGTVTGLLLCSAFMQTMRRETDAPSIPGKIVSLSLIFLVNFALVGPLFVGLYHYVFFRSFGSEAWWLFGLGHLVLWGFLANLIAWKLKLKDMKLVVMMNLAMLLILGCLLPCLHLLLTD